MLRKKLKLSLDEDQNIKQEYNASNKALSEPCSQEGGNFCLPSNCSIYFSSPAVLGSTSIPEQMLDVQQRLNNELEITDFLTQPISYIYNPTVYAIRPLEYYLRLYCNNKKNILFMGMNPGPWGMCQTGIPFGEVRVVKNWLQINDSVDQPSIECPNRKIDGFNCTRKEVSGDRFWNFFRSLCITPNNFFQSSFVYNYCPLAFMGQNGNNITPADLEIPLQKLLQKACDEALREVIEILQPEVIIGIGRYAQKRALNVVQLSSSNIKVLYMPHPSPRSVNNNNWAEKAEQFITENNLMHYFLNDQITNGTCSEKNSIN